MNTQDNATATGASWDAYWQGATGTPAFHHEGASHPALAEFWQRFFTRLGKAGDIESLLDLASGTGAVLEAVERAVGHPDFPVTCVDASPAAVATLKQQFPFALCVAGDLNSVAGALGSHAVVTSQFGVEYAGNAALFAAFDFVAPAGTLALVVHHRHGRIRDECATDLEAVEVLEEVEFIPRARALFAAGFQALGGADRRAYDEAARQLSSAVSALEDIMRRHGRRVAGDLVFRLYNDVADIHENLPNYAPADVLPWLERLEGEVEAFRGRLVSMCDAAIDAATFDSLCETLEQGDFEIEHAGSLDTGADEKPLAWTLIAHRRRSAG